MFLSIKLHRDMFKIDLSRELQLPLRMVGYLNINERFLLIQSVELSISTHMNNHVIVESEHTHMCEYCV
jgi:hypothetical protein